MSPGRKPALTIEQRAEVAAAILKRRELRKKLDANRVQQRNLAQQRAALLSDYKATPTLAVLEQKYGLCSQALGDCVSRPYKTVNPLDAAAIEAQP